MNVSLHQFIDFDYGADGDSTLKQRLSQGIDPEKLEAGETLLHVAARRRRLNAMKILLEYGANINTRNSHGKTAYAHAARRGFHEITALLEKMGADKELTPADQLAVALSNRKIDLAREILSRYPGSANTGNPEEDRLLADVAGRQQSEPVTLLIKAGANLTAPGLDSGTPLHQSAWFGQPQNARLLLEAGASVDIFDTVHQSSPLGWAVHGSRYSGGADQRQDAYVELVRMLLEAGSSLRYPDDPDDAYLIRLRSDATPRVKAVLPEKI